MKTIFKAFLCVFLSVFLSIGVLAVEFTEELDCRSAVLIEQSTGKILYASNEDEALPPASVTKIMTLLLVAEAVDSGVLKLDDTVVASDYASSMGGSQVFLKAGEQMSVSDMIKSVTVASANDCAVALAEHLCGSEGAFVDKMNERAKELGMEHTTFKNCTGLDDTVQGHEISAEDIAIMSRELMSHDFILDYTTIWMDTIRNGEFGLTNTNRLIRFYKGANGLKTGFTSSAKFCISAAAKRDGMQLISVIMGSPTRDVRNECAKKLLDFGFANYGVYKAEPASLTPIEISGANVKELPISHKGISVLLEKAKINGVTYKIELPESVSAPIKQGDKIGEIIFYSGDEKIDCADICADCDVNKITFFQTFYAVLQKFLLK